MKCVTCGNDEARKKGAQCPACVEKCQRPVSAEQVRVAMHAPMLERARAATASAAVVPEADDFAKLLKEQVARLQAAAAKAPVSAAQKLQFDLTTDIFQRLERSHWPLRFHREITGDWGCPRQAKTFARCREMFQRKGAVVALVGERGTGKTTIGAQLALARAWEDLRSREDAGVPTTDRATPYRKLTDLLARYKALYADFGTVNPERLAESRDILCRDHDLIVIDEIHECEELKTRERMLTDLIDRRYSMRNDTLLICNLTGDAFNAEIGDSVKSRISEHGAVLECTWGSWREKKA